MRRCVRTKFNADVASCHFENFLLQVTATIINNTIKHNDRKGKEEEKEEEEEEEKREREREGGRERERERAHSDTDKYK